MKLNGPLLIVIKIENHSAKITEKVITSLLLHDFKNFTII